MELFKQFQGFIGSLGFGFFFYMFIHFIYRVFQKSSNFIKIPSFLITFLIWTLLYFSFLVKFNNGIMNIFYPLSLLIGICFYHRFYFIDFDEYYLYKIEIIEKYFKLKRKMLFAIINKKIKERKHVKTFKNKK